VRGAGGVVVESFVFAGLRWMLVPEPWRAAPGALAPVVVGSPRWAGQIPGRATGAAPRR
jgi:hypothetical protein